MQGGIYALVVRVHGRARTRVGRLGKAEFRTGCYVYVGSAMTSLQPRILRHVKGTGKKKIRWHVDYLLDMRNARVAAVGWRRTRGKTDECALSRLLELRSPESIRGFGCSDCDCNSHLYHFPNHRDAFHSLKQAGLSTVKEARLIYCTRKAND